MADVITHLFSDEVFMNSFSVTLPVYVYILAHIVRWVKGFNAWTSWEKLSPWLFCNDYNSFNYQEDSF